MTEKETKQIYEVAAELFPKWMEAQRYLDHESEIGGTTFDKEEKAQICIAMVDFYEYKIKNSNLIDASQLRNVLISFMESLTSENITEIEIAEFEKVADRFLNK